jgi:hypothetical protein
MARSDAKLRLLHFYLSEKGSVSYELSLHNEPVGALTRRSERIELKQRALDARNAARGYLPLPRENRLAADLFETPSGISSLTADWQHSTQTARPLSQARQPESRDFSGFESPGPGRPHLSSNIPKGLVINKFPCYAVHRVEFRW